MKRCFYLFTILLFSVSLFVCMGCKAEVSSNSNVFNFSVGDILFSDGTYIKAKDVVHGIPDEQVSKAISVIAVVTDDGRTLGIGLNKGKDLEWAQKGSVGYKTKFSEIASKNSGSVYKGFTFSGDKDGSDNWECICGVDSVGSVDAAVNYPVFDFANNYGVESGLEGTEYESGWYVPSAYELYGVYKNSEVVQKSLKAVKGLSFIEGKNQSSYWSSSQSDSFDNKAYQVDFDDGYVDHVYCKYESINVLAMKQFYFGNFNKYNYGIPSITSVKIPPVITGYTGELKITICGENLKGHNITCDYSEVINLEYFGDEQVVATIMCKGVTGEYNVNITCGLESKSGTLKIGKIQCYEVGDIVLADGSSVSVDDVDSYSIDVNNKPVGVVISSLYGGTTGKIMGIQKDVVVWSSEKTAKNKEMFEGIISTYEGDRYEGFIFGGDLIGANNWDYICSVDTEGSKNPEINYPVFNFALNYGSTAGLIGTDFATGWYVPSVAELYDINGKLDVVQKSLTIAGGFDMRLDEVSSTFWSSSTTEHGPYEVVVMRYFDSNVYIDVRYKQYSINSVLVVRDF